ncbi:hypothetical protein KSP40_PGU011716 [Platanthera guangdongensis]|uniref:60S acidic ribosomal protein P2 n=1 Tax=Platanthera guangdongensis TaxID=2320717 RepID=A0ABR2LCB4_9ASPA
MNLGCRKRDDKSLDTMLVDGRVAGVASWVLCYPLDVVKSKILAQSKPCGYYGGEIIDCLKNSLLPLPRDGALLAPLRRSSRDIPVTDDLCRRRQQRSLLPQHRPQNLLPAVRRSDPRMKVIAAYLLAILGGNANPSAHDLKHILGSVLHNPPLHQTSHTFTTTNPPLPSTPSPGLPLSTPHIPVSVQRMSRSNFSPRNPSKQPVSLLACDLAYQFIQTPFSSLHILPGTNFYHPDPYQTPLPPSRKKITATVHVYPCSSPSPSTEDLKPPVADSLIFGSRIGFGRSGVRSPISTTYCIVASAEIGWSLGSATLTPLRHLHSTQLLIWIFIFTSRHAPVPRALSMFHSLTTNPSEIGADADDERINFLLSEVKGKDITELIASGREKFASVPSGGGGAVAVAAVAGGGGAAAAAPMSAEPKKEEKVEEKEESDDVRTFLFLKFFIDSFTISSMQPLSGHKLPMILVSNNNPWKKCILSLLDEIFLQCFENWTGNRNGGVKCSRLNR